MMIMKRELKDKRHLKIRKTVSGSAQRPRLAVFRSGQHIYAQVIDDTSKKTLVAESDLKSKGVKKQKAFEVGKRIAEKCLKKEIKTVVFDRGGFLFHGRVAEVARGAREGNLQF